MAETRKMLELPDLAISATCVRVPVFRGHSESVQIETTDPISADQARELLMVAPGVAVVDEPAFNRYPLAPRRRGPRRGVRRAASAGTPRTPAASRCGS